MDFIKGFRNVLIRRKVDFLSDGFSKGGNHFFKSPEICWSETKAKQAKLSFLLPINSHNFMILTVQCDKKNVWTSDFCVKESLDLFWTIIKKQGKRIIGVFISLSALENHEVYLAKVAVILVSLCFYRYVSSCINNKQKWHFIQF